jgi:hypothetical protein
MRRSRQMLRATSPINPSFPTKQLTIRSIERVVFRFTDGVFVLERPLQLGHLHRKKILIRAQDDPISRAVLSFRGAL